jgi:AhpD family alkylhydroperoxidase
MSTVALIQYEDASPEVRAVFDDIKRTRNVPDVNNFWKALANHPETLRRTWETLREVMQPGALDPLTKEMIYIAVSVANNCEYCIHSHTASAFAKGMTGAQYGELLAVVGMAAETNALANALKVPVDPQFMATPGG